MKSKTVSAAIKCRENYSFAFERNVPEEPKQIHKVPLTLIVHVHLFNSTGSLIN